MMDALKRKANETDFLCRKYRSTELYHINLALQFPYIFDHMDLIYVIVSYSSSSRAGQWQDIICTVRGRVGRSQCREEGFSKHSVYVILILTQQELHIRNEERNHTTRKRLSLSKISAGKAKRTQNEELSIVILFFSHTFLKSLTQLLFIFFCSSNRFGSLLRKLCCKHLVTGFRIFHTKTPVRLTAWP